MSLLSILAIYILLGSILYLLMTLPSLFAVINIVLSVLFALFAFRIIGFPGKFPLSTILLLVIFVLSAFQLITTSKKYAAVGSTIQLLGSLTLILILNH